jgi:hypothetical protein
LSFFNIKLRCILLTKWYVINHNHSKGSIGLSKQSNYLRWTCLWFWCLSSFKLIDSDMIFIFVVSIIVFHLFTKFKVHFIFSFQISFASIFFLSHFSPCHLQLHISHLFFNFTETFKNLVSCNKKKNTCKYMKFISSRRCYIFLLLAQIYYESKLKYS